MTGRPMLHGSAVDLLPGTELRPGAEIGRATWDYTDERIAGDEQHVWVTTSIENAIMNVGGDHELFYVYEVEPHGDLEQPRAPYCPDYTCSSATVLRRVLTVTGDGDVIEPAS